MMQKRLSIGILVESYTVPNWVYTMLEKVLIDDCAQIVAVVVNSSYNALEQEETIDNVFEQGFYSAMQKMDCKLYKYELDALEKRDLRALLKSFSCIMVEPIHMSDGEYFSDGDCERIEKYNLDVLLKLGFGKLRGSVLGCAKYGVWTYQLGDNGSNRSKETLLWGMLEGRGTNEVFLKVLADNREEETILCRSVVQGCKFSIRKNANDCYWKVMLAITRKLRELYEQGGESFFNNLQKKKRHPAFYASKIDSFPSGLCWFAIMLRYLKRIVSWSLGRFFYYDQYVLLFSSNQGGKFFPNLARYVKIIPPKDRFWADPFILYDNGLYYVFIEEVTRESKKGHISYFVLDKDGNHTVPKKIIDKSICFPEKWELVMTLMNDIAAYDVTLLQYDGKWWLFANVQANEGASSLDELFLFYAEDLFSGVWTPHKKNPIISDVASARPAGNLFIHNGNLYRPSQNSAHIYGYGVKINHVVELSESEYKEECINTIEPLWDKDIIAVHSLNFAHNITIIDGLMRKARVPSAIFRRLHKPF